MGKKDSVYGPGESFKTGSQQKRDNMVLFVEWLLAPAGEREPALRRDFAEVLGVTTQTLRNYERDAFTINTLQARRREVFKVAEVDEVIRGLVYRAKDVTGTFPSPANAAAKILLDWAEKQNVELNADAVRDMSDDELKAMIIQMYDQLEASA